MDTFFMWCTIINALLLAIMFLVCVYAGDRVYKIHSIWFPISREAFNVAIYCFLGLFKIFILVFNLVPWIACVIAG
ncbi:MAG: DUF6868 family protein [Planctomycetota bacterium]